jgi:MerR family transcriptional regulator, copper efflux regulator
MAPSAALTIGTVAQRARVPLDTVRYYERRGLLPVPPRSASGYRQYPADAVRRVMFIKRAQALGFTLEEIAGLLALRHTPSGGCEAVERQAQAAMVRIDAKLSELTQMRGALARLATTCRSNHPPYECPMLAALDELPAERGPTPPTAELIYFTGCPHVERTRAALREAFEGRGLPARWEEWDQRSSTAPDRVHGYASPTVLVAGRDVTGIERTAASSACQSTGGPSVEVIRAALARLEAGA